MLLHSDTLQVGYGPFLIIFLAQAIAKLLTLQPPTALQLEACKELDREPTEVPVSGLRGRWF